MSLSTIIEKQRLYFNTDATKNAVLPLAQFPGKSFAVSEPYGIALIMSPWNYPIQLTLVPLVGAIAAGNCAVIKPSAYSPATSKAIADLIADIFPSEYITVVQGGRVENAALLELKFDYIFFTGSTAVGHLVMEKASNMWQLPAWALVV